MSDFGHAHFVEVLSVARARTDLDAHEKRPVVILTIRPEPGSWRPHNLGLTIAQAERFRDDLDSLLSTPATFLLVAVLALATGCSAKVEVVNGPHSPLSPKLTRCRLRRLPPLWRNTGRRWRSASSGNQRNQPHHRCLLSIVRPRQSRCR